MPPQLDFQGQNTATGTHGLHAYAAKCPPQLVRYGLQNFSKPGETVLDPMVGSGTTLVEAKLLGRSALGFDIDPLARLIAEVKCSELDDKEITLGYDVLKTMIQRLDDSPAPSLPVAVTNKATSAGPRPADWFSPKVANQLAKLAVAIETLPAAPLKDFFWVGFSSLILARTSVANARDIIHSRHHRFVHTHEPDVLARFDMRIGRMRARMKEFVTLRRRRRGSHFAEVAARLGDARQLPKETGSVDLVFTSPPYATALDYPRAHFLAVAWMQPVLGVNLVEYLSRGAEYIGSARGRLDKGAAFQVDPTLAKHSKCQRILDGLAASSPRQARLVQRYFLDMAKVLGETERVLRSKGHAMFVICPSHIRKVAIPTDEVFVTLGREVGLRLKARHARTIDCRRRLLPYMDGHQLGARMSTEYVLIFQKP